MREPKIVGGGEPSIVSPNTVVLTFANIKITSKQISDGELSKTEQLFQQKMYTGSLIQTQHVKNFTYYSIFDQIEILKQCRIYQKSTVAELMSAIAPLPKVNEQTARRFYNEHRALFSRGAPLLHVREIVVKDQVLGEQLLTQLHNGRSFTEIARQYSVDPQSYRDQGGDVGWVSPGQMSPTWDAVAFSLSPGTVSNVFRVGNLYFILKVVEDPKYEVVPYKNVLPSASLIVAKYLQQQRFLEWLSTKIIEEQVKVKVGTYTSIVNEVLSELRGHPDQGLFETF